MSKKGQTVAFDLAYRTEKARGKYPRAYYFLEFDGGRLITAQVHHFDPRIDKIVYKGLIRTIEGIVLGHSS